MRYIIEAQLVGLANLLVTLSNICFYRNRCSSELRCQSKSFVVRECSSDFVDKHYKSMRFLPRHYPLKTISGIHFFFTLVYVREITIVFHFFLFSHFSHY